MDIGVRGCGHDAAHGGGGFQNRRGQGRDDGIIVGAVDGDGQGGVACSPVVVDDLIGDGVGKRFPDAESLHGGQAVVQDVGVVAIGGQRQRAVRTRPGDKGDKGHCVVEVGIARLRQDTGGGGGRILGDGSCGRQSHGRVVGAVDGNGQDVGGGPATPVADRIGERVGEGFPDAEPLHDGQAVVEGIAVGAVRIQRQRAVQPRLSGHGQEGRSVVDVRVRGLGEGSGQDGRVFRDGSRAGGHGRRVVGAVDGDDQRGLGQATLAVADRGGEGIGEGFPDAEPLHGGQGIVQNVGIAAAGRQCQRAVGPGRAGLGQEDHRIVRIGIKRHRHDAGEHSAGVFGHAARGDDSRQGRRIDPVDGDGQRVGGSAPVVVRDRVGERVGQGFPEPKLLHGGQTVVQGVDVRARGIERQAAVQARRASLRHEGRNIVRIGILRRRQSPCRLSHPFGDCCCGRVHGGRVVGAVDGDGQGIGGGAAVPVRHRVGEGVGQRVPHSQSMHGRQAVVQRIGIGPGGAEEERTVLSLCGELHDELRPVSGVGVGRRGQYAAGRELGVFLYAGCGGGYAGGVVDAGNGDGQGTGDGGPVVVGHGVGKRVVGDLARAQAVQGGAVGQDVGVGAVDPQGQRAPCSGLIGLGHEGDGIVDVGVMGNGQQA